MAPRGPRKGKGRKGKDSGKSNRIENDGEGNEPINLTMSMSANEPLNLTMPMSANVTTNDVNTSSFNEKPKTADNDIIIPDVLPVRKAHKRSKNFGTEESLKLVKLWTSLSDQELLDKNKSQARGRAATLWNTLTSEMKEEGFDRTPPQFKNRLYRMRQDFHKAKKEGLEKQCPYYEIFDAFYKKEFKDTKPNVKQLEAALKKQAAGAEHKKIKLAVSAEVNPMIEHDNDKNADDDKKKANKQHSRSKKAKIDAHAQNPDQHQVRTGNLTNGKPGPKYGLGELAEMKNTQSGPKSNKLLNKTDTSDGSKVEVKLTKSAVPKPDLAVPKTNWKSEPRGLKRSFMDMSLLKPERLTKPTAPLSLLKPNVKIEKAKPPQPSSSMQTKGGSGGGMPPNAVPPRPEPVQPMLQTVPIPGSPIFCPPGPVPLPPLLFRSWTARSTAVDRDAERIKRSLAAEHRQICLERLAYTRQADEFAARKHFLTQQVFRIIISRLPKPGPGGCWH